MRSAPSPTCRSGSARSAISSFGAEEVQDWGLERTAELLIGKAPRASIGTPLRPAARPGRRPRGIAKRRARPTTGISTWACCARTARPSRPLRTLRAVHARRWASANGSTSRTTGSMTRSRWMKRLGVTYLRTGLSWADSFRPNALDWFDRQMEALADFDVTVTFCFTPEHRGIAPPPHQPAAGGRGIRRVLRRHDPPLCGTRVTQHGGSSARSPSRDPTSSRVQRADDPGPSRQA